ncbi:MAG: UDP-N-acetylmuramoyl-tripeptide--D-alanyl-D-alanine ligase [Bacteroidota bacterium]
MTEQLLSLFHEYPSISTDTRQIGPGQLYFALKGARFNGNKFAKQALEAGAAYAIIDEAAYAVEGDARYVVVHNVLKALQDLAHAYRQAFDIPILGLTGSNGKTTTKELVYSVLSTERKVHATKGNFNNHIGVPLTLLAMPRDTELAIIEMGANQPGDIQELAEIADPTLGLITNVGYAHLEKLKGLDGVRETKGALFRHVKARGGQLFVNVGDSNVVLEAGEYADRVTYGKVGADFELGEVTVTWGGMNIQMRVGGEEWTVNSSLSGSYNAINILAATAVGHTLGISSEGIRSGIQRYVSQNNRSQHVKRGDLSIWLDAYNANPSSMQASISHIFSVDRRKKIGLILGDMYELGEEEAALHGALADHIRQYTPALVIGVGPHMKYMTDRLEGNVHHFADREAAKKAFSRLVEGLDVLLIKGSRAMALEKLLDKA